MPKDFANILTERTSSGRKGGKRNEELLFELLLIVK